MKSIIITHSDLDGIMGGILGMLYAGSSNVMYMPNPNPGATNTAIDMMVENYKGPLTLTVVDRCSPSVDYIESLKDRGIDIVKYTICDHHITSMPDHKAAIDAIGPEKCIAMLDTEPSGTENIYKLIEEKYPKLANIVSTVGNWDTFRWKDMDNLAQYEAKKLNGICAVLGNRARQVFSDIVMSTMKCEIDPLHYIFTKYDILADIYNDKIADSKRDSLTYGVRTVVTNSNGDKCKLLLATFLDYSIISQVADDILFDPDENIDVVVFLHSSG